MPPPPEPSAPEPPADGLPFPGSDLARARDIRATAGRLRAAADRIEATVRHVAAYDRPDVWRGALAERSRAARAEAIDRLVSPTSGAAVGLREAAARLEARAARLDPPTGRTSPPVIHPLFDRPR